MLSRRLFVACGLCAVTEFAAIAADAPPETIVAPDGVKRTFLQRMDGPTPGFETLVLKVEMPANYLNKRHFHPGIETTYIAAGGSVFTIDGQPARTLKVGDTYQVPTAVVHGAIVGDAGQTQIANYVVEKGKPLATLAS